MSPWFTATKPKVSGKQLVVVGMSPFELLEKAGYFPIPTGGFVRSLDKTHRYHAYVISLNTIELHTDLFKYHRGRQYHVASTFRCAEEKSRIRGVMLRNSTPKVVVEKPIGNKKWKASREEKDRLLKEVAELNKNRTLTLWERMKRIF